MSLDSLYQHRATVDSLSTSDDAAGGTVNAYTTRATMNCLIRAASSSEIEAYSSQNLQVSHVIRTGYTGVQVGDRVTDADGKHYDVRGIWKQFGVGSIPDMYEIAGWQLL